MSRRVNAVVAIVGEINLYCGRRDRLSAGGRPKVTLSELCQNYQLESARIGKLKRSDLLQTLGFVTLSVGQLNELLIDR